MSKTIIEVKCTDQVLTLTNTPVIASGGVGEDYVSAEFCEKWDGFAVSILFWRQGVDPIPVLADEENLYQVPPELMTSDGVVYFGAVGVDPDGVRRTSEGISYRIHAGAITENTTLPEPDGDVFTQLLAQYADVKLYVSTRIDEVADAATQAGVDAAAAKASAELAVGAAENVIFPDHLEGYLAGDGSIYLYASKKIGGKSLVSFISPCASSGAKLIQLLDRDTGKITSGEYSLLCSSDGSFAPSVFEKGDHVVALLDGDGGIAYVLNPRFTEYTLDEMNRRFYPGTPASVTTDGTMTIALDYEPEDKMVLVFVADEASSQVNSFWLEYETAEDGLVQAGYFLCDANDSPVKSYGFYAGDYVVVLLTPADKRATVLNPRVTKDTMNLIQGIFDNLPEPSVGGCEVISYVGDGTSSLQLVFSKSPKVIQIESLEAGGFTVSATLFRDEAEAKLRVFSDGNYSESVVPCYATWAELVELKFYDSGITPGHLNVNNTKYVAIGIM